MEPWSGRGRGGWHRLREDCAVDRVRQLESVFQGEYVVTLKDGTRLTSSRTYRERLEQAVGI